MPAITGDRPDDALRGSEAQFRSFLESMDQGYILVEVLVDERGSAVDLLYVEANSAAVRMTGTELVGRRTRELSPDFEAHWFETFGRVARTGVSERHELTASPLDAWYDIYMFKVGAVETRRVAAVYQDVTIRKRAEAALRDREEQLRQAHDELESRVRERTAELALSNTALQAELLERRAAEQQIKALFKQLVSIQEDERRRIARDIHDQLGQQMTALRLQLEVLLSRTAEAQPALAGRVGKARELAQELDQSIDFLTWELTPTVLDDLGLVNALGQLVSTWSHRFRIAAHYQPPDLDGIRFSSDVETNLYRLAQEALHNAYKHAGASRVSVVLEQRDGHARLLIEDDGRGFDPAEVRREAPARGLGLVSMRERAALMGGELQIESAAGRGTIVQVRVPLPPTGA